MRSSAGSADRSAPESRRFRCCDRRRDVVHFGIETIQVDMALARRAAAVRARTRLKSPTRVCPRHGDSRREALRLETFDEKVVKAYRALHPVSPDLGYGVAEVRLRPQRRGLSGFDLAGLTAVAVAPDACLPV